MCSSIVASEPDVWSRAIEVNARIPVLQGFLSTIAILWADLRRRRSEQQQLEALLLDPEFLRDIGAPPSWLARSEILRQQIRLELRGFD
jgi:hypothetical protein